MRALVTGGSGFIGSHLVRKLIRENYKVRCLVRTTSDTKLLRRLGVELWFGDLTDKKSLKGIAKGIDTVFHLAAVGDINAIAKKYYALYRNVNVRGTKNLLEECVEQNIRKFVHFSSVAAMGEIEENGQITEKSICNPKTPYEVSKYESELVALNFWKKYNIPIVILRPSMIYGEDERKEMSKIEKSVNLRIVPIIGDGCNFIHMAHVKDVIDAAIAAAKKGRPGRIYIISSEYYTWNELVDLIAQKKGLRFFKFHIPISFAKLFVFLIEVTTEPFGIVPPLTLKRLDGLKNKKIYNISEAANELGYRPRVKFRNAR